MINVWFGTFYNMIQQALGKPGAVTRAEIRSQDKLLCNAEITFRLVPFPSPHFRDSMENVAAAISFPMELAANG